MKTKIFLILFLSYALTVLLSYGLPKEQDDCETAIEAINDYVAFLKCIEEEPDNECELGQTVDLSILSQCNEAYDYIKNLIQQENSEPIRCGLIRYLGWVGDTESATFLKQLLKNEKLSVIEKSHILFALCQIGKHSEQQDIMDEAVKLVHTFCETQHELDYDNCAQLYYFIGGEPALNFFTDWLENEATRLPAAFKLALLGEHEKTFPVFAAALFSENTDDIFTALQGLNAIGTNAAYLLMKSQIHNEDETIARTAQWFCQIFEKKGGKL
jgi:hypothetical protein